MLLKTRAFTTALLIVAMLASVAACGGGDAKPTAGSLFPATSMDASQVLAELEAAQAPVGVDAELWAQLKEALADGLTTNNQQPATRFASAPPMGESNRVTDLVALDNGDGTFEVVWHYRNTGDYDQNGAVSISDITPIAMHYSETYDIEDVNNLLAVIDGSGSNAVDIADITPIAMHYSTNCAGYRIQRGDSIDGQFSSFSEIVLADATGDGRLSFSIELLSVIQPYLRVVPYDAEGIPGEPSEPVFISIAGDPPEITSVSPTSGSEGESVAFSAIVNGTPSFSYSWDFGGGAEPNTSTLPAPTVTLGAAGEYSAGLTVSNDYDEDTYPFTLTVIEVETYSVSGHVEKDTGGGLQGVTLTLTPGNYPATTNASGDYTITDVPSGNYTLTPVLVDWTFDPVSRSVNVSNGNVTDKDFTATDGGGGEDCVVSAHVEKNTGGGLQGVTLTLTPGGYSGVTNANGNCAIIDVPEGWYTLTPVLAGWSFDPTSCNAEASPSVMTPHFFSASAT